MENRNDSSEDKNLLENNGSSENKKDNYLFENLWENENLSEDNNLSENESLSENNNLSENENLLEDIEDINNSLESEDDDTINILQGLYSDDEFSSDSDNFNLAEGNNI